jgi:hypothetical protein
MPSEFHAIIQFTTITDLVEFQLVSNANRCEVDTSLLTITGQFNEAAIELAKEGYKAVILHTGNS